MNAITTKGWKIGDMIGIVAPPPEPEPLPIPGRSGADWYVAAVRGGAEKDVAAAIRGLGLIAYLPLRAVIVRRPPRLRPVRSTPPVFAGYVFFESFSDPRSWAAVRAIDDVIGIVSNQNAPARIRAEEIGDLMAAEDMGMFDATGGPGKTEIIPGDPVSLIGGRYQGYEARVRSVAAAKARVMVVGRDGPREVSVRLDLLRLLA